MRFDIITIFPQIIDSYIGESILKRAIAKKLISVTSHDLRQYTKDKHHKVDDRPYGGGPGMILQVEPIVRALRAIKDIVKKSVTLRLSKGDVMVRQAHHDRKKTRIIMLAPEGKQFTQKEAKRLAKYDKLIILCGRYEGFDARVDDYIDEKISIGPYVLAGGELPALIVMEAVARHVPGVVGHADALKDETFSHGEDYVEYPQYSRPEVFEGKRVPRVLLSGNHAKIEEWRGKKTKRK